MERLRFLSSPNDSADLRSVALKPSAGEPEGHESNSHGLSSFVGVLDEEPVPDWFSAGAERMTLQAKRFV